jgi:hypothetical protein
METWYYEVVSIDGDYANLRRMDMETDDLKLVARALLPEEDWYEVDVITCAAPDLRKSFINPKNFGTGKVSDEELQRIHEKRARRIFEIARYERMLED